MRSAVHFVGFKGEELFSALRIFGPPDFFHRYADPRFFADVAPGDVVVYANGEEVNIERRRARPSFNDANHF